jgi:hypothetical protein
VKVGADGAAVYTYTLKNLGDNLIAGVFFGTGGEQDAQLRVAPSGCESLKYEDECACPISAPRGWSGCLGLQEENELHFLVFHANRESAYIRPDKTAVFRVALPARDATHDAPVFWTTGTLCSFVGKVVPERAGANRRPN